MSQPIKETPAKTPEEIKTCTCFQDKGLQLAEKGLQFSPELSVIEMVNLTPRVSWRLPLRQLDGKKVPRGKTDSCLMYFCPFCATPLIPKP